MRKKKVVIIGAGIAGLSAGCYFQINGYDTEIYEAHNIPGGLCTGWNRKGYLIEGCIHGLLGSAPTQTFYKLWNEIIEMDKLKFIDMDIKSLFLFEDGRKFVEYASLELLQKRMIEIAPEDEKIICEFISDTKKFQSFQMSYDKPKEFLDLLGKLKMIKGLPLLFVMKKWINVSAQDFSNRFKNPLMQDVVKHFACPILFEMFVLSEMDMKHCGYPIISSLEFSKLFEKKYLDCGGQIHYKSRVSKVMTKDNNTFDDWPHTVKVILSSPHSTSDGSEYNFFDIIIYNNVEGLAPENKTLLVIQLDTKNGEYWSNLRDLDKEKYRIEKKNIAKDLINILDRKIGDIKNNIEIIDIATPATYIRYTGNWKGSIQGWANENIFKVNPFKKELPGLEDFFMIGQWVEPGGGLPNVFKSGRDLVQIICKRNRKKFIVD